MQDKPHSVRLILLCVFQINFQKACEANFLEIYLDFKKAQSAVIEA